MAQTKGNAAPAVREPIAVRSTKLNHLLLGRGSSQLPSRHLASRDSLLDALFALYDECNREQLRRDKNIALFLDKYQGIVTELRHLRVSISDFEMKTVIGRGHFGDIHMVKERATGDIYAMKILRKDDTLSQREVAFYEEERDILVRAPQGGPWLTQLQYAFQDTSHLYLVMEFMPGGDLFGLLDRSGPALSEDDARFYMAELVLALHALHTLGYIHRDVKPDNVLIDRTGHIKLADFGSAAKLTDRKSTRSRLPVGTPHYVAPEVLSAMGGGPAAMCVHGTGCDWWSLGVVGYEMLFGQNPFADERITVTYNNIMNFKDSLTFPKEAEVSETAVKMLQGLLTSADKRFSYGDMCSHEFFASVDWNNIRQTVPPFVPSLSGDEDTSNFDEFEHETPRPRVPALRDQKKGFEGSSLPFVGFTHTQCTSSAGLDRTVSFLEVGSPRRDTFHIAGGGGHRHLQEQVASLAQREETLLQECKATQARLREAQEATARLEEQLTAAEAREADLKADNQNLNMLVNLERQGRLVSEEKAVQLVAALKRKYRRQDELLRSGHFVLSPRVAAPSAEGAEERDGEEQMDGAGQQGSAPEHDKEHLERELQKERARCSKYKEHLNRILKEGKECMDEMQKKHKLNVEYIDGVRKEVTEAVEKQHRAEQALNVCREECSSHQEKMSVLEKQLACLKLQVTSSLEASKKDQATPKAVCSVQPPLPCVECAVALGQLKAVQEERDRLISEAAQIRRQLSRLQEVLASGQSGSKSELHRGAENLRSVVARLEELAMRSQEPTVRPLAMCGSGDNNGPAQDGEAQAEKLNALERQTRELQEANARYVKEIERLNIEVQRLTKSPVVEAAACLATDDAKTLVSRASPGAEVQPTVSEATAALETQLAKTREYLSTSRARCGELQLQLCKKEEGLSAAQLDARIAKREAKRFEEGELALKTELGEATKELESLRKSDFVLKGKVAELQQALQREQRQMAAAKLGYEKELAKLEERVQMLKDNCGTAKNLEAKCTTTADECRDLTVKCKVLELEVQREAEARSRVEHDSQGLEEELRRERAKTDKLIKTLQLMKETCEELERQVVSYETMYQDAERKLSEFDTERATHREAVDKLTKKNALLKESLMLEKAARKRHDEELEEHRAGDREASASLESLRRTLSERDALLEEMGSQTLLLRRELGVQEAAVKAWQRREDGLLKENLAIKEEASRHITTIASLKSSNLKLSQELEECKASNTDTMGYIDQLESEMEGQKSFAETEMMKLNQTLAQQTKLIDFLQTKVAELDKKKKKFFGGGRSAKDTAGTMPRVDTDGALERERSKCRRLQDQLDRARAEVMVLRQQLSAAATAESQAKFKAMSVPTSPKSRALLTGLTMSPSTNLDSRGGAATEGGEGGGATKAPPLRMQHNIPHRFQVILCMRGTKCAACLDSVHFGRYASRCEECQVVCHPKCSTLVPSTCGVPPEYVRQFSDSVSGQRTSPPRHVRFAPGAFEVTFDLSQPQGWVKVPRSGAKPGWDKCFLVLRGDTLYMLNQAVEPTTDAHELESLAYDSVCLCPSDGEALVSSAVSATELLGTAKMDLPYTFKLELKPFSTCWPSRCLYIMVPTFDEKQMWVSVLEECVGKNLDPANKNNTLGDTVLSLEGDQMLDINCSFELSFEYLLLGAMEGLFVVDLVGCTVRRKVADIPAVFQIGLASGTGVVLAILGDERKLRLAQWDALQPWVESKPGTTEVSEAPSWRLVEDIGECHLFAHSSDGAVLCVATAKAIHLMQFNPASGNYSRRKLVNTSEPCSCIHFTPLTILIGTDTFYEIDAKDYSIEQFLDPTDTSLSFLMFGATQLRSFPVSILQVAPPEYNPEYLLCFHELGVFVDEDGRRTREDDLKWKRLPLAFAYQAPYLFVGHFNAIEILEIKPRGSKDSGLHRTVLVSNPRFLGLSHFLGSMYLASFGPGKVQVLSVRATCEPSSPSAKAKENGEGEDEDGEMEFSFTSSVVEMLDD